MNGWGHVSIFLKLEQRPASRCFWWLELQLALFAFREMRLRKRDSGQERTPRCLAHSSKKKGEPDHRCPFFRLTQTDSQTQSLWFIFAQKRPFQNPPPLQKLERDYQIRTHWRSAAYSRLLKIARFPPRHGPLLSLSATIGLILFAIFCAIGWSIFS